jgi:hypothetical protein
MARARSADEDIVWDDQPQIADADIVWDEPAAKRSKKPTLSKVERFLKGLRDPIDGGAQLLDKIVPAGVRGSINSANNWLADKTGLVGRVGPGGVSEDIAASEREYQQRAPGGVDWMRIVGNVASPANLALAARGTGLVGSAATGAGSAMMNPVDDAGEGFWDEKTSQAKTGAVGGAAFNLAGRGMGRVMSPNASRNPDLALLRREGVEPTIGQTLGGGWNRFEEKATSMPLVGDMIRRARDRSREQFNVAAINRATRPVGVTINEQGQAGVGRAQRALGHAYDDAERQMGSFRLDRRGIGELRNLRNMAQSLPDRERAAFQQAWQRELGQMSPRGVMLPEAWKRTDSVLGKDAARFSGANDGYQQQLGDALSEFQRILRDTGQRQNPGARAAYEAADRGYAALTRVENASNSAKLTGGSFTPGQLLGAVQRGDTSVRDRVTARGEALMQDLGTAGQNVLGNKVPDSGTAGRLLTNIGSLGAGGGAAGLGLIEPTTAITAAVGTGLGMLAYTAPAQRLLRVMASSRPNSRAWQAAAAQLRALSRHAAPAGAQVGLGLMDDEE